MGATSQLKKNIPVPNIPRPTCFKKSAFWRALTENKNTQKNMHGKNKIKNSM
jgi:hypothetical protein